MISIKKLFILFTLCGVSIADNVCQTDECKQTAQMITSSMDHSIDPCDDFYEYSCGTWKKNHPLNGSNVQTGTGHFQELSLEMGRNLLSLMTKSSVTTDPKYIHPLINFYKGCVNTKIRDSHETRDFNVVKAVLKRVGGWPLIDTTFDEEEYNIENGLIELNKVFVSKVILNIEVMSDLKNNTKVIVGITNPFGRQAGIEGIYRIPKPKEHNILDDLSNYYELGAENPILAVAEAMKGSAISATHFTTDMIAVQTLDAKLRSIATPINNPNYVFQNYDNFKILAKDLDQYSGLNYRKIINGILKAEGIQLKDNDMIFADKEYLKNLGSILKQSTKRAVANLIGMNLGVILNRFTTSKMAQSTGVTNLAILPQVCLSYSNQILPDLLGRYYMDKVFPKESSPDMKEFITTLKDAFNELLSENQWLDSKTKKLAINKLHAISQHIAFPEYTLNDTALLNYDKPFADFSENSFLSAIMTALSHQRSENTRALRDPEPKGHWPTGANAVLINAFYNPEVNGIFFPAGIAQFPFYQHTRPKTLNLGAIGMVISHELTHAFDNMGSLFDENGNYHKWFSDDSTQVFTKKAQCFVNQYNQFEYDLGFGQKVKLNGLRTLGENIADNGGIRIAYRALELYKKKNAGKLLKLPGSLSNLSEEKLFFLSYANLWCSNKSPQSIASQIAADPHSIEDARVIATLSNLPEFAKAFNCKAGSNMNPSKRCVLWG